MSKRRAFVTWTGSVDGLPKVPTISRRIFAEGNKRGLYVELYVWRTLDLLRAAWGRRRGRGNRRRIFGFWRPTYEIRNTRDKRGREIYSKKLGEIHLPLSVQYSTIAHETYHATRYFARRKKLVEAATLEEDESQRASYHMPEEVNARFMGHLSNQICSVILDHHRKPKKKPTTRKP